MRNGIPFLFLLLFGMTVQVGRPEKLNSGTVIWGFYGHRLINRLVVYTLPDPLFKFYKKHQNFLEEHAVDPDKRRYAVKGEAECHFIDLDRYGDNLDSIRANVPFRWSDAVEKFGEESLRKHGIGPWNTYQVYINLQKAFREKKLPGILKYSAELGHYIGDMHVPLHTTENYNGQFTGQQGIHGLWESRLPELFAEKYKLDPAKAKYVEKPQMEIWRVVEESHLFLQQIFSAEDSLSKLMSDEKYGFEPRGSTVQKVYSLNFSKQYQNAMGTMVEQRMNNAIELLGCIIYTAWVNAGQPDLSTLVSRKVEIQDSDSLSAEGKALKVRDHE